MHDPYASGASTPTVAELSRPLATARGWMKFLGIVFVIQGALTALTLVGILIAWVPIWMGVLLLQSADAIGRAHYGDDATALEEALGKLRTYFVIQGVLLVVGVAFAVLYFVFFGAFALSLLRQYSYFP